ncbi:ATP-NAD kinase-like domain-containing protein [Chytriomyces sp. MP71]|nr:ATP-NAD kinase-like domain-containing protein [Chytriomyces sp. MP71]
MDGTALLTAITLLALLVTAAFLFRSNASEKQRLDAAIRESKETCIFRYRRILVLLNPYGGGGKAIKAWQEVARSALQRLDIEYDLIKTTHAGHAKEIMSSLDDKKYAGAMILSGDGMFHECINGLFEKCGRDVNALRKLKLALVLVPTGTCNGFSSSLGATTATASLINLARCKTSRPVDLYQILSRSEQGKAESMRLDMHCFSTCIVADHDELVERKLRKNPFRTILAPIRVISAAKSYPSKIYLKPVFSTPEDTAKFGLRDGHALPVSDEPKHDHSWRMINAPLVFCSAINTEMAAHNMIFAPGAKVDDGAIYILVVRKGVSRFKLALMFLAFERGTHTQFKEMEIYKVEQMQFRPLTEEGNVNVSGEQLPLCDTDLKVLPSVIHIAF